MTPNSILASPTGARAGRSRNRISQHAHRLGSCSPDSIPSSPTSIHSSFAIFERDVEAITNSGLATPIGSYHSCCPSPLKSKETPLAHACAADLPSTPITTPTSVLELHNLNIASSSPPRPTIQSNVTPTTITYISGSENAINPTNYQVASPIISATPDYTSTISSPSENPSPLATTQEPTPTFNLTPILSPLYPPVALVAPSPIRRRAWWVQKIGRTLQSTQPHPSLTLCASSSKPPHIPPVSILKRSSAIQEQVKHQGSSHLKEKSALRNSGDKCKRPHDHSTIPKRVRFAYKIEYIQLNTKLYFPPATPSPSFSSSTIPSSSGPITPPSTTKDLPRPLFIPPSEPTTSRYAGPARPHPYLDMSAVTWDLRDQQCSVSRNHHSISNRTLCEPATQPPLPFLRILSQHLPWSIKVYASNNSFVTVEDVFSSIYRSLRTNVAPSEFDMLPPPNHQRRATRAYEERYRRRRSVRIYEAEKRGGMKRVDFLMRCTLFRGISNSGRDLEEWHLHVT